MKSKLEYIWLDGYKPTQSLRSKTRADKKALAARAAGASVDTGSVSLGQTFLGGLDDRCGDFVRIGI